MSNVRYIVIESSNRSIAAKKKAVKKSSSKSKGAKSSKKSKKEEEEEEEEEDKSETQVCLITLYIVLEILSQYSFKSLQALERVLRQNLQ
jgi:hypothetical protein